MRPIIVSDLCEITGYSRDQMRGLLAELPRFARRRAEARVARVYSNLDALLIVLLCRLETVYGLKRSVVSTLCEAIAATFSAPRAVSSRACLIVNVRDATCVYVDKSPVVEDGLVVALGPIFMAIDAYLLPTPLVQRELGLSATGAHYARSVLQEGAARENTVAFHKRKRSQHG